MTKRVTVNDASLVRRCSAVGPRPERDAMETDDETSLKTKLGMGSRTKEPRNQDGKWDE